jgi:excisionase family DNA binding protein
MQQPHNLHVMQEMQLPAPSARPLLTALEVQHLLHVDRSTVYRMAEDGRLPAIRVGRSWRFPADRIEALLAADAPPATDAAEVPEPRLATIHAASQARNDQNVHGSSGGVGPVTAAPSAAQATAAQASGVPPTSPTAPDAPALDLAAARAAVEVGAELLGVMMVVTDMRGRPLIEVANPCPWFAEHGAEPGILDRCIAEWRDLADHPDLSPRFQSGAHGFECARAFIREGSTLVGMVLAGGISPSPDPTTDPDLYHLDTDQRDRVLGALPRIAAAIPTRSPIPTPPAAPTDAATKEN